MLKRYRHWARQLWDSYRVCGNGMGSVWVGKQYTETYRRIYISLTQKTSRDTAYLNINLKERSIELKRWSTGAVTWELSSEVFEDVGVVLAGLGIAPPTAQAVPADYQRLARRTWDRAFCRPRNKQWSLYLYEELPESARVTWSNRGPKKAILSFELPATIKCSYREDPHGSKPNDFESTWVDAWGPEISPEVRLDVNKGLAKLGITGFLL